MAREIYEKFPDGWHSLLTGVVQPFGNPVLPPPVSGKRIGIYMAGNNTGLNALTASWPTQPNHTSWYFSWNTTVAGTPLISSYAGQGRTIVIELATRISGTNYILWADIPGGSYDAHIISLITSLDALGVRVLLSLDNEADIKFTSGTGEVAPGQTLAQYVAAANHVADLIHAHATHVQSHVWLAGGNATNAGNALPAHSKLDNLSWDPYSTGSNTGAFLPTQRFANFISSVLVPKGYADIPRHITETGIMTNTFSSGGSYSVAQQIAFYQDIPNAMDVNQIQTLIWFRDNAAHNYVPTDSSVDAAFRDMIDATYGS